MTQSYLRSRKLRAASVVVLASSLQICGCNPAPDCRRVLELQLSSLASENLREHCAQCLTARQMTSLIGEQGSVLIAGTVATIRSEATIQQALRGDGGPSFYDPNLDPNLDSGPAAGIASVSNAPTVNRTSPLRRSSSSDNRFMPLPISESVFFLYKTARARGAQHRVPIATAFVLSVPDGYHRTPARFLVTARHVVDPEWAHCSNRNPSSVEVQLNRRSGGVGYETISLEDTHTRHYFIPADGTSDLAIMRLDEQLIPDLETYKFVDTPVQLIPSEADLGSITATQQVVTASLQAQIQTDRDAFPISGRGVLSSTSDEPVYIHCGSNATGRPLHMWLIDGAIQQGLSGAPVYTSLLHPGDVNPRTVLLGVQAVAWPDRGVAGITPSNVLADLVHSALANQNQTANLYHVPVP